VIDQKGKKVSTDRDHKSKQQKPMNLIDHADSTKQFNSEKSEQKKKCIDYYQRIQNRVSVVATSQ